MFDILDQAEPAEPPEPAEPAEPPTTLTALTGPTVVDALVDPDSTAAFLASMTPGADVVAPLSVLDPHTLSDTAQIDALVTMERQIAWLNACQQRLIAAMAHRAVADPREIIDPSGRHWIREGIACALKLAPVTAEARIEDALLLTGVLQETLAHLEAGLITAVQARTLLDHLGPHQRDLQLAVQAAVLPKAPAQTAGEFRQAVRRAIKRLDHRREENKHRAALTERRVAHTPRDDGMAEIWALLPADGAAAVMAAVQAWSTKTGAEDTRTADQRRADALVEIGLAALHDPLTPRTHGARPDVQVTVALSTLLGHDQQPGDLTGHGPIPASMARRMAADPTGTWRRLIVDPIGRLIDYGTTTYRPPADLTRHVIARDQHCTFPTCTRSARRCDLDHREPYPAGTTCAANLHPLCKRHHILKHHSDWNVTRNEDDGSYTWTSPTRHRYRYLPPEYPVPNIEPPPSTPGNDPGLDPNAEELDPEPPPF